MSLSTILLAVALAALVGSLAAAGMLAATATLRGARLAAAPGGTATADTPIGWRTVAHGGLLVALAILAGALVLRTVATGHAPWSNLHEFSAAFAAFVLGTYALLERRAPIRGLAPLIGVMAAALVVLALAFDDRVDPLVPALQQPLLLTIHVGAAVCAYAISAMAFAAAVGELIQRRAGDAVRGLPTAATCRAVGHRSVLIAFPILTGAIALGSVWANLAWRSYWSNDPKELAAAATWLVFAAYLHVAGRRDRLAAAAPWLIVLGFAGVLFTYLGAGLIFVGEHSYAAP